ncbi:helix-turn-helix transcriptional regulator [Streptomyces achromogenes]
MLAQRAGVGQPTVSKIETGRMVPSGMCPTALQTGPPS